MRRVIAAAGLVVPIVVWSAAPAGACGGLVGANGTIELVRTTTLAAYSDGIERYITAFEFTGEGESVGSIIPLPDEPTEVTRAGDWTLQRLVQEVTPQPEASAGGGDAATAEASRDVEVILETEVDALDITVIAGGGDAVGEWAVDNGFLLTPDSPEVLDYYAERSPYFMAAKFNASRADDLGQEAGDSTPIMATIPTDDPWVPVRILGLGLEEERTVEADVFLLTEDEPSLMAGGTGMTLDRSEEANDLLLDDLRSDTNMEWVPRDMWLSYLTVDAPAQELDYDLAVSARPDVTPSLVDAGVDEPEAVPVLPPTEGTPVWPLAAAVGAALGVLALGWSRWRGGPATQAVPAAPGGPGGPAGPTGAGWSS